MTDRARVVLAVVLAVSVVSAPVAVTADADQTTALLSQHLVVGSEHTTATDFANGTYDNLTVEGSGEAAVLAGSQTSPIDSYDDGNLDEYSGDTGGFTTQTGTVYEGSHALESTSSSGRIISTNGLSTYPDVGDNFSARIQTGNTGDMGLLVLAQDYNNFYEIRVDDFRAEIAIYETVGGSTNKQNKTDISNLDGQWLRVEGHLEDTASGVRITATLYNDTGSHLGTVSWEDTTSPFTSGGVGARQTLGVTSYMDSVVLENTNTGTASYTSDTHAVGEAAAAWTNLTLDNTTADVSWQYNTGSGWVTDRTDTYTSSGNRTVNLSADASEWRVRINYTKTGANSTRTLSDEGVLFEANTPTLSNGSPTGYQEVSNTTLSVDVSDPDFGLAQGDTVTVNFSEDGTPIGSSTTTSNGTVSVPYNNIPGGTHEITATATDSYGNTVTESWTFSTPSELVIRNETAPNTLVNDSVDVTLTFFGQDGTVEERTATNGTVDMSGLPTGTEFAVVAQADTYEARTIIVPSLIEQQTIYLLPSSEQSVQTEFVLDDRTGVFANDESSKLRVQKAITINGSTEYRTIVGDYFDSSGSLSTILHQDQRYRLVISNDDETRVLGSYTAANAQTVPLTIGEVTYSGDIAEGVSWGAQLNTVNGTRVTDLSFVDPDRTLASVDVEYRYENGTVIDNFTVSSPPERYNARLMQAPPPGDSALVEYTATFEDGSVVVIERPVGDAAEIGATGEVNPRILSLIGWVGVVALTGLVVIYDGALAGFTGVVAATAFTALGVLDVPGLVLSVAGVGALVFLVGGDG